MNIDEALPTFIAEAAELLREMELGLLACANEKELPGPDSVNSLFRCAHTIKGSSGLFGLDAIVAFVHNVETVLDRVRLGEIALDGPLIGVLLECKDHIEALVACVAEGQPVPEPQLEASGDEISCSTWRCRGWTVSLFSRKSCTSGPPPSSSARR